VLSYPRPIHHRQKPPIGRKVEKPSTPKPKLTIKNFHMRTMAIYSFLLERLYHRGYLHLVAHGPIIICLHMDPLMMWYFHQANKTWYLVMGNIVAWKTLEIMKFDNVFYYQTIVKVFF